MKSIFYFTIVLFFMIDTTEIIYCQSVNKSNEYHIQFFTGYTSFDLTEAKNLFEDIIGVYRNENIPLRVQREFPGNLLYGATAGKRVSPNVFLGLGVQHSWTHAYSLYADRAGEVDIKNKVAFTHAFIYGEYLVNESNYFKYVLGSRLGLAFCNYKLYQAVRIEDISSSSLQAKGSTLAADLYLGSRYSFNKILISGNVGIRILSISKLSATSKLNDQIEEKGKINFDINMTGFFISMGVGLKI